MQKSAGLFLIPFGCFLLWGCAGLVPPPDMVSYQEKTTDEGLKKRAVSINPNLMSEAEKDYQNAQKACEDKDQEMCDHYSTLAKIKLETVLEQLAIEDLKKQTAKKQTDIDIAQRTLDAEKIRKEAYAEQIKSLSKIAQLETKLESTSDKAEKERMKHKIEMERRSQELQSVQSEYSKQKGKLDVLSERKALAEEAGKIVGIDAVKQTPNSIIVTVRGLFEQKKIEISSDHLYKCEQIAKLILKYPDYSIVIEGHTDSRGSDSANLAQSQARAQALVDLFIRHNVPINRMTATGKGESVPISDNRTQAGKELNRRIEIKFLYPPENPV
jgi:outer membrane protein OmpA-like peptidoglycan-associated protein